MLIPRTPREPRAHYTEDGQIVIHPANPEFCEQQWLATEKHELEAKRTAEQSDDGAPESEELLHDSNDSFSDGAQEEEEIPDSIDDDEIMDCTEAATDPLPAPILKSEKIPEHKKEIDPSMEKKNKEDGRTPREPSRTHIALRQMRESIHGMASELLVEGHRQYASSAHSGARATVELFDESLSLFSRIGRFLFQPVWVPGKNAIPRQRSRLTLFTLDVVRFGGTFAGIFLFIFVSLNYQSFWQIASASLDPVQVTATLEEPAQQLEEKLTAAPKVPGIESGAKGAGSVFSFVPPVGPPENRIIIPRLNLNVPIVLPSNEPLYAQDWARLEEEIQTSLQDGVVHYPGTARPGQAGNFFLTGHSSYYPWAPGKFKSVFARLADLDVGDEYWIFYGGDKHRYVVQQKFEVKPSDVSVLDQPGDRRMSTLMTCTPVGTTLRRLIVQSQEVDPITGVPLSVGDHGTSVALPKIQAELLPI